MYDPDEAPVVCSEFKCVMNPMPEQELCSPIRRDIGTLYRFDGVMNLCISNPCGQTHELSSFGMPRPEDAATSNWSLLSSSLNMSFSLYSLASWTFQHQISTSSFWWILTSWQEWWWVLYPMISRPDFWAISPIISASSWCEKFHWSYLFQVASMLRFVFLWHHQRQSEVTLIGSITINHDGFSDSLKSVVSNWLFIYSHSIAILLICNYM